jgi:O-antigen/teichoic acid export membrane protein
MKNIAHDALFKLLRKRGVKRILKNMSLLWLTNLLVKGSLFAFSTYLARQVGPAEFGVFALATAIPSLAFQASSLGLDVLVKRELAKDRTLTSRYLNNTLSIRIGGSLVTVALLTVLVFALGYRPTTRLAIIIGSLSKFFESISNLAIAVYQGHEEMQYQSVVVLFKSITAAAVGYLLVYMGHGVITVLLLLLCLSVLKGLLAFFIISKRVTNISLGFDFSFWHFMVSESYPWILVMLFMATNYRIDTLMLSILKSERDVGLYNSAYSIMMGLAFIPNSMTAAMFPNLSQSYHTSLKETRRRFNLAMAAMFGTGLVVSLPLILKARMIIELIYSRSYLNVVPTFRFLMLALLMMFLNNTFGIALNAMNLQKNLSIITTVSAIGNLLLNLTLIPHMGYEGAAIAAFSTEVLISLLSLYVLKRHFARSDFTAK